MLERYKGREGQRRLVELFANQELVLQNRALAKRFAEVAKLKQCKEQEDLYIEGHPANNKLYFILSGTFDLLVKGTVVRQVKSGEVVGEFPVLDPSLRYTVTIRAREPSVVGTVLESQFLASAEQFPDVWRNMAKMELKRLHARTRDWVRGSRSPCVFIGHGHRTLWARVQIYLKDECNLDVVTFESESHVGESIVTVP